MNWQYASLGRLGNCGVLPADTGEMRMASLRDDPQRLLRPLLTLEDLRVVFTTLLLRIRF